MPPFSHKTQLRVFIDPDRSLFKVVWAATATWNGVFGIEPHKLVGVGCGTLIDLMSA